MLVIVLAGIAVYWVALPAPFLFDDQNSILNNTSIRRMATALAPPRDTPVAGRPLVNLTLAMNYAADGLDVTGYRAVNLAIHLLAALTLFGVVRRTLMLQSVARPTMDATSIAFVCSLVWMLHPLQTETVNYLSQRTEALMGLCYLQTLYWSIRGNTVAAVIACAAGMASKESMVTAPLMVVLYDRVFRYDSLKDAFRTRRGLYGGLAATWLVLAALMATTPRTSVGFGSGASAWVYFLNQCELIVRYLWLSIWPRALVLDYGLPRPLAPLDVLPQAALLVAFGVLVLWALVRRPMLGFLGAWFFITLGPTSSFVPIATEVGAERRMYLPLAGLVVLAVILVAGLVGRAFTGRQVNRALAVTVCLLLALGSMARNREYESRLSIAQTIVDRWPSGRGRFLLASELILANRRTEAMAELRESARDYPGARYAIAVELMVDGKFAEAAAELETFLQAMPDNPTAIPARDLLGRALLAQGRVNEGVEHLQRVVREHPDYEQREEVELLIEQARGSRVFPRVTP
jgi:hypothetical protein